MMIRFSGTMTVGLGIWLLCQYQSSAQESGYASATSSPAISDQIAVPNNVSETDGEELTDNDVELAAWLQQPPTLSTPGSLAQPPRRSTGSSRQTNIGLSSVPNMFGDLAGATSTFVTQKPPPSPVGGAGRSAGTLSLPIAGGGSRVGKISENDSPIPRDRIFFSYNHFQNVFQISETPLAPPGPTLIRQEPIDRYTLGFEKAFFNGWTSVEVRMPFIGSINSQLPNFGYSSTGNIGNLTVVLKSLVYMDNATAVGAGVAIETPTGTDSFTRIDGTRLQFRNDAAHLLPYIGFVWSPGDPRWGWGSGLFLSGFAQVDINANGNRIDVVDRNNMPRGTLGTLTDQNLGFLDLAAGYWLYRNPDAPRLTGLAAVTELHYTTTLQDVDRINGTVAGNTIALNSTGNRFDILNGTIGVQALLFDASSLRVAGVFPLGNEDRRLFDSEVQVQFNRRF
jgi:hypothetical protein